MPWYVVVEIVIATVSLCYAAIVAGRDIRKRRGLLRSRAQLDACRALMEAGRPAETLQMLGDVLARHGSKVTRADGAELATREVVVRAATFLAGALYMVGRPEAAMDLAEQVIVRFGDDPEPCIRERVARAFGLTGAVLEELGELTNALGNCDDALALLGPPANSREHNVRAMFLNGKGSVLGKLGRWEEALAIYEDVIAHHGDGDDAEPLEIARAGRESTRAAIQRGKAS